MTDYKTSKRRSKKTGKRVKYRNGQVFDTGEAFKRGRDKNEFIGDREWGGLFSSGTGESIGLGQGSGKLASRRGESVGLERKGKGHSLQHSSSDHRKQKKRKSRDVSGFGF